MKKGRRKFFSKSAVAFLAAIFPTTATSGKTSEKKMVKMLTSDGKVVEVDAGIVEQAKGKKTSNKEIRDWSKQILDKNSK